MISNRQLSRSNPSGQPVTDRKLADVDLHSGSLYARNLIETSLDPLVTISREGKITDANQAAEHVTGLPRKRLVASDFSDYFTEPDTARLGCKQVFAQSSVRDYPLVIRNVSGALTEVLYNASVFRNEAGEVVGVFAAARDISKLRQASRYARSLLEASLDPLVTFSVDGKIMDANEAAVKVTGVPREKLIGTDFADCFTEPEKAREGYRRVFSQGFVTDYSLTIRHVYGRLNDVLYNASVYKDVEGKVLGVFAAARGITNRKQMENGRAAVARKVLQLNEELEQRVKARTAELAASNRELEALAYSVSHDLRAPLRHIDGFLALLQKRFYAQLDSSAQHYLDNTTEACRRLGQMIDELLQFSRSGRSEIHKQLVDPNEIAQKVRMELEQESRSRVVLWQVDDLPTVAADALMLRQILENLLANALKFTRTRVRPKSPWSAASSRMGKP